MQDALAGMLAGSAPVRAAFSEGSMLRIFECFQYFFQEKLQDKGKETILSGQAALRHALRELEQCASPRLSELERFHVFSWMMTEEQRASVATKTKTCLASVSSSSSGLKSGSSSSKLADDKASKKAKVEQDGVMSLFG